MTKKSKVEVKNVSDGALALMRDRKQPLRRRVSVALSFLKSSRHRAAAAKALDAMASDPSLTPHMLARIFKAMHRYIYKPAAAPKKKAKSVPKLGKKAAAQAAALAPPEVDLSGPATMAILMDPDLYDQWLEIHKDDPEQQWNRKRDEVRLSHFISTDVWDALNSIKDFSARIVALDEVLETAPLRTPSP